MKPFLSLILIGFLTTLSFSQEKTIPSETQATNDQTSTETQTAQVDQQPVPTVTTTTKEVVTTDSSGAVTKTTTTTIITPVTDTKTPQAITSEPRQRKGGGAGGFRIGVSFDDMTMIKGLLSRQDSLGDTTGVWSGLNNQINDRQTVYSSGGQGYYQTNSGFRVGGAMNSSFAIWQVDGILIPSNNINLVYWNGYFGALVGGSFGNESNHFNVSTTIGIGVLYTGFVVTNEYDAEEISSSSMPYFATDLQVSYMHSFGEKKIFHMGVDGGAVLQATTGDNYDGFTLGSFTSINPNISIRFIWGRKS